MGLDHGKPGNTALMDFQMADWTQTVVQSDEPHEFVYKGSSYIEQFLDPDIFQERVRLAVRALRPHLNEFDAIAFQGMSGALIAPPVARELGKSLLMVRKPDDLGTHSDYRVEGDYAADAYIILDDIISLGGTRDRIVDGIKKVMPMAAYKGTLEVLPITESKLMECERNHKPYPLDTEAASRPHSTRYLSSGKAR